MGEVIAAVHGLAVAGGLELVLCCDLVVASRSASFGDAHANYGLLPAGGGSIRLPRRVGPARAKHLMFTGVTVPAEDLAGTDLITALVGDGQLISEVDSLVAAIAGKSPLGIAAMKASPAVGASSWFLGSARSTLPGQGARQVPAAPGLRRPAHRSYGDGR